jgi:hypothetical protein
MKRAAIVLGILFAAYAILMIVKFATRPTLESLDVGDVKTIKVEFEPWGDEVIPAPIESSDTEAIAELVKIVKSGQETSDHKCSSRGSIRINSDRGQFLDFWFLPGHNDDYYEFRHNQKIYRVPRTSFVDAMKRLGVRDLPLQCK